MFYLFIHTVDVPDYCAANPKRVLPDPDNCAHYFNCSSVPRQGVRRISSAIALGKYGVECQYPDLFDDLTQQCKNFTNVNCSTRTEPQAPCEYTIPYARLPRVHWKQCNTRMLCWYVEIQMFVGFFYF